MLLIANQNNFSGCSEANRKQFEFFIDGKHIFIFQLDLPILFAGEDCVQVSPRHYCCIFEHFIVSFKVREMNLLLEDEFIQFGVCLAMRITNQVIEILFYLYVHLLLRLTLSGEEIVQLEDWNDMSAMFLVDMLH